MLGTFIDHIGAFMLLPFFALYITQHFGLSMTGLGGILFVFAVSGTIGGFLGGALADKFGRRSIILFGILFSGASSLLMGFIDSLVIFIVIVMVVGLLQDIGGPAQSALVADVLPQHRQSEGFAIWRVVVNISAVIGPLIGGILAANNFRLLFIGDALLSFLTAVIVFLALPETKPKPVEGQAPQSLLQTAIGYRKILADKVFMAFIIIAILSVMVYAQMNTTLPVFLRDIHNMPPESYSYLIALNATMVVLMQFWITRKLRAYPPLLLLALGVFFLAVGFGMYGFGGGLLYFAAGMVIITIGEMVIAPTGQALAARMAPEEMRGRYMAMFAFSWAFPFAIGPLAAGLITDRVNFNWVWYAAGLTGLVCTAGYLLLHARVGRRLKPANDAQQSAATAVESPTS
ncbi:MAG: MFS transporter [Chloroflexi bacterium]|nr:MFS transporter [Chloroflexota bacterium]